MVLVTLLLGWQPHHATLRLRDRDAKEGWNPSYQCNPPEL
jgi:hypothetical protein